MPKKYNAIFKDEKGRIIMNARKYGVIYGEFTEEKVEEIITYGRRIGAAYCEVTRRTDGHNVAFLMIDIQKGKYYLERAPARYGPGYYTR